MQKQTVIGLGLMLCTLLPSARAEVPTGVLSGHQFVHTADSLKQAIETASVALPNAVTGAGVFIGKLSQAPQTRSVKVPVVILLHGSSGLGLAAIREWQSWLAEQGIASVAPDSFALPDRITYKSPIDKINYERIHALRLSEIAPTLDAVRAQPWAAADRLVLAGMSEGAVAVSRYPGHGFVGRIVYSWSCEQNYFVDAPRSTFTENEPVLNVISAVDPYFSSVNQWLGNDSARGNCSEALKGDRQASVLLIPDAPHTLINFPAARDATLGFLRRVFK